MHQGGAVNMINGIGKIGEGVVKRYTTGEEIVNSLTHGIGGLLSIAGTAVLIVLACVYSDAWGVVGAAIFGSSLIILYLMSTLYHSITNRKAKKFFRIMDHNTIFFLIAGTYTPITLVPLRGAVGWVLFGLVWAAAVVGIVLNSVNLEKFKKMSMVCYMIMGWVILIAVKPMVDNVYSPALWFILIGGLCYTGGTFFYIYKKKRYFHSVWHLFTLAGSIFHYFAIMLMLIHSCK